MLFAEGAGSGTSPSPPHRRPPAPPPPRRGLVAPAPREGGAAAPLVTHVPGRRWSTTAGECRAADSASGAPRLKLVCSSARPEPEEGGERGVPARTGGRGRGCGTGGSGGGAREVRGEASAALAGLGAGA